MPMYTAYVVYKDKTSEDLATFDGYNKPTGRKAVAKQVSKMIRNGKSGKIYISECCLNKDSDICIVTVSNRKKW